MLGLEVLLLVHLVLGIVRVTDAPSGVSVWEYVGYLVGVILLIPAGVIWSSGEKTRGGTARTPRGGARGAVHVRAAGRHLGRRWLTGLSTEHGTRVRSRPGLRLRRLRPRGHRSLHPPARDQGVRGAGALRAQRRSPRSSTSSRPSRSPPTAAAWRWPRSASSSSACSSSASPACCCPRTTPTRRSGRDFGAGLRLRAARAAARRVCGGCCAGAQRRPRSDLGRYWPLIASVGH